MVVGNGPKNLAAIKKTITADKCAVLFVPRNTLFLRAFGESCSAVLNSDADVERVGAILRSCNLSEAGLGTEYIAGILKAIRAIPVATEHFDNRGVFSTHYLKGRLWDDLRRDIRPDVVAARASLGGCAEEVLAALGWKLDGLKSGRTHKADGASVVVTSSKDLGARTRDAVAPSYTAVAELKHSAWVILTNGTIWRLYTSRVSASTTSYFEIDTGSKKEAVTRYLVALFGAATFRGTNPQIDEFFKQSMLKARALEDDMRSKILRSDGLFLDIAKGVLDHDMKKKFSMEHLQSAKETALAVLYRIWFVLYAESRDLLPVRHAGYAEISLRSMRNRLDGYEDDPDGDGCWTRLLELFRSIKNGSPEHNLPQYDGELFGSDPRIDGITVRNQFIAKALRELFETGGESVDYGSLGVRHLGSIYEALLEFGIRQADKDVMLLEDNDGVREVASEAESTYSYKKNDLYLASKAGIMSRRMYAAFYTPDEIVAFLVGRGLEPLFQERESMVAGDIEKYKKRRTAENRRACIDRLLDLQVVDPAMGSGHFLVEALNQITKWITVMLNRHPDHPLVGAIELDRKAVLDAQKKKGVSIDKNLLTADTLLKRRVMKRCIFGVDLNSLAVELARLSLWLDSFAIGMPLTYINHHIKHGDSTIGMWLKDLRGSINRSLVDWFPDLEKRSTVLERVSRSPDITMQQVADSKKSHQMHEEQIRSPKIMLDALVASLIDKSLLPRKAKKLEDYILRLGRQRRSDEEATSTNRKTQELAEKYSFFHWELEMTDAFTDSRRGFDLVIGNPPWKKVKPSTDEFFSQYDLVFRSLRPNTKKIERANEIMKDPKIKAAYGAYLQSFRDKSVVYKTCTMQGSGDNDLWQLMLERMLNLVSKGGIMSIVIPAQMLTNVGSAHMRRHLLDGEIMSAYVFENRLEIFPIDSRSRFVLLTARDSPGPDEFPAAFYLHNLSSLKGNTEREKFTMCSKRRIRKISPNDFAIPEVSQEIAKLLEKLSAYGSISSGLEDGWDVVLSRGFDVTNDASLFREDGAGWPVLKGKNMHQFNPSFVPPDFTAEPSAGLERLGKKRAYRGRCADFHESSMIVFRNIARSTDTRTVIAAIIPPHAFYDHSLSIMLLYRDHAVVLNREYHKKTAYLIGILNSTTFDFVSRSRIATNVASIIKNLPIPDCSEFDGDIADSAARLNVGINWGMKQRQHRQLRPSAFEAFADSLGIENKPLSSAERIDVTAHLDALVAHAYGLSRAEYEIVLDSFKFGEDPSLRDAETAYWSDSRSLQKFYGEVRRASLSQFDEIAGVWK